MAQQVLAIDDYTSRDEWNIKGSFEFVQVNSSRAAGKKRGGWEKVVIRLRHLYQAVMTEWIISANTRRL